MAAEQSLREGRLDEAKVDAQDRVRREPADPKHRVFLFQLLCVLGEWPRALNQLQVLKDLDASALPMVGLYGDAIHAEAFRSEVFAGRKAPIVLGEPDPWVALAMEAVRLVAEGHAVEAAGLRARALDDAPAVPGTLDDRPFEWIADADSRLGPLLEIIVQGRYYWVPYGRLVEIRLEKPVDLRDLVWSPAIVRLHNGGEVYGLIPTRYPGSETSDDGAIRLARKTEWRDLGADCFAGLGQRVLATDAEECPLLDARTIRFGPPEDAAPADPAGR